MTPSRGPLGPRKEQYSMVPEIRTLASRTALLAALAASAQGALGQNNQIPAEVAEKMGQAKGEGDKEQPEFPKFEDVSKDYVKVISTPDAKSLYTIYTREKDAQVLAELPRNFDSQKLFFAYDIAGGDLFAGIQLADQYAQWKRYDKKLALIEPNYSVTTTGDTESKKGFERVFTDRVL